MSRFVTYNEITNALASLLGYESTAVPDLVWRAWRQLASDRMTFIWEQEAWPDISTIESRTVTSDAGGDYIPFTQNLKDDIGEVFAVWSGDPVNVQRSKELRFLLETHGVTVPAGHTSLFVWYRKPKPELTGDFYNAATTYAAGSQLYDPTTGDFYDAKLQNAPTHDLSDDTRWDRIQIPSIFKQYIVRGTAADYYRHNSDFERAREMQPLAEQALDHELMKLKRQQDQRKSYGMSRTYPGG